MMAIFGRAGDAARRDTCRERAERLGEDAGDLRGPERESLH